MQRFGRYFRYYLHKELSLCLCTAPQMAWLSRRGGPDDKAGNRQVTRGGLGGEGLTTRPVTDRSPVVVSAGRA